MNLNTVKDGKYHQFVRGENGKVSSWKHKNPDQLTEEELKEMESELNAFRLELEQQGFKTPTLYAAIDRGIEATIANIGGFYLDRGEEY
jgi:hypothetical protein